MTKIILASGSPRRKELLTQVGLEFEVISAHGEEVITKALPMEIVDELSFEKASEVADRYEKEQGITAKTVIIGADTIVAYDNEIMGKPKDSEDAVRMIKKLQDNTHQVYTGVALIIISGTERQIVRFQEKTDVSMYPMTDKQIRDYIATGESADKAGSYAIQGKCAIHIREIKGDYNNVVGLPVARLYQELIALGIDIYLW